LYHTYRMDRELGRNDWLKAARIALLRAAWKQCGVEKLARDLKVTKGSFYWHFTDREELLEILLREWEEELLQDIIRRDCKGGAWPGGACDC